MKTVHHKIEIIQGDITKVSADAIVNAANSSLLGGGGVDGAIHRAGGLTILEDCRKIVEKHGSCRTGEAVITTAGKLSAKYVIHTVGPIWNGGNSNELYLLSSCYRNSLQLALKHQCNSIAFPSISTGVYRFPKDKAAVISIDAINEFLITNTGMEKVLLVCYDDDSYSVLHEHFTKKFSL